MSSSVEGVEPLGKRGLQARETRARIYAAAWRLIEAEGFDEVSVDRICREAGVAKGAFYHHFRSKADLIIEGYSLCDKYFEERVKGQLKGQTAPDRIVEFLGHQVGYAVDMGVDLIRQTYKSQLENGTSFFISNERTLPSILKTLVDEGQASGELRRDLCADYVTAYLLRASRGLIYDWCLRAGAYDLKKRADEDFGLLIGLFLPPSSP